LLRNVLDQEQARRFDAFSTAVVPKQTMTRVGLVSRPSPCFNLCTLLYCPTHLLPSSRRLPPVWILFPSVLAPTSGPRNSLPPHPVLRLALPNLRSPTKVKPAVELNCAAKPRPLRPARQSKPRSGHSRHGQDLCRRCRRARCVLPLSPSSSFSPFLAIILADRGSSEGHAAAFCVSEWTITTVSPQAREDKVGGDGDAWWNWGWGIEGEETALQAVTWLSL